MNKIISHIIHHLSHLRYIWKNQPISVDEEKETLILEVILPKIIEGIVPEMNAQLSAMGNELDNLPNFDDTIAKNNAYSDIYHQSGGDDFHNKYGEIVRDVFKTVNDNTQLSVVMEKSHADPKQFVPVEHLTGFNNAMKQVMDKYGINDVNLVIDLGRLLQHNHFIEMDN